MATECGVGPVISLVRLALTALISIIDTIKLSLGDYCISIDGIVRELYYLWCKQRTLIG